MKPFFFSFLFLKDLFEVVDRRAKLVVSELAEDQPDSQASGIVFKYMYRYLCQSLHEHASLYGYQFTDIMLGD